MDASVTPVGTVAAPQSPERVRFGRLQFTTGPRQAGRTLLRDWLGQPDRPKLLVGFINPHVYNCAGVHGEVTEFLESCDFVCVDGVGVSLAAKLLDRTILSRVVATDLFVDVVGGLGRPINAVLVGATGAEVAAAADELNEVSADLCIVDTMDGFSDLADYKAFFMRHREIDTVLVGAGSPKSEQLLLVAHEICDRALSFHIGAGTIKLYSGTKRKAPKLVSRLGLEWMHRIVFEPHTRSRYVGGGWTFATDLMRTKGEGDRS